MRVPGPYPFHGEVVWLTPEQGGREQSPPAVPDGESYAATGFVPPRRLGEGLASFVLHGFDRSALRSPAEGKWLIVENGDDHEVRSGSVVVVTEGPTPVAFFTVHVVDE